MAGLVPAIHVFVSSRKSWMPGTRVLVGRSPCRPRPRALSLAVRAPHPDIAR